VPRFYRQALRLLAGAGLRPQPSETAREFCQRVAAEVPAAGAPLRELTAEYERRRFGAGGSGPDDAARVAALAASLPRRGRHA
jgi:hypothetical protein